MAAKIGIVYATDSGMVRRCIYPDSDGDLASHLGEGESLHLVDSLGHPEDSHAIISAVTGMPTPDPRCAVVDPTGIVVNVIYADSRLDNVPGHVLIPSYDGVGAGCKYDSASDSFIAPARTEMVPTRVGGIVQKSSAGKVVFQPRDIPSSIVPKPTKRNQFSPSNTVFFPEVMQYQASSTSVSS